MHRNLVVELPMVDKSFSLYMNCWDEMANVAKVNESKLWHRRYAHCHYEALSYMVNKSLVMDIPLISHPN